MTKRTTGKEKNSFLLFSASACHWMDEKGEKGPLAPSKSASLFTGVMLTISLVIIEKVLFNFISTYCTDLHQIMEVERHQQILARHIGVDAFSCFVVSCIGWNNREILSEVLTLKTDDDSARRIYAYQPSGHHVLLFFSAYQVKNLYDTFVWNDGILFVLHHIFAGTTAILGMYPGVASMYGIFFMGISEISTCVLCLLANFDPDFGVAGLDVAFPLTRIFMAALFAVTFILVRIVVWPIVTFHFLRDSNYVLKTDGKKLDLSYKTALRVMMCSSVLLSILQVIWLGEIIITGKKEINALLN